KMVFLKRNMQTMDYINVFPPDLDAENNDFVKNVYECDEVISE
ncbi:8348_t:CDS:1, partial [Rhizophagus irregularis]